MVWEVHSLLVSPVTIAKAINSGYLFKLIIVIVYIRAQIHFYLLEEGQHEAQFAVAAVA